MELPVELNNKRKDCDFYHLKVDAKIYKHFLSSDSNTSRADKEQEEKQLQEHRVVQALTKARAGCQSEKKNCLISWFILARNLWIFGRSKAKVSYLPKCGEWSSAEQEQSRKHVWWWRRRASHCEECRCQENRLRQRSSSNPWLSPSTVMLRFLGRKCLKALSGSRSSEGGKKNLDCSLSFCKFRNSYLELHCRGHGGQRNY